MMLGTPRINQGQIVEVSYGWHDGDYYRRSYDRSDRSEAWCRADRRQLGRLGEYDAGGADYQPPISRWIPCAAPAQKEGGRRAD